MFKKWSIGVKLIVSFLILAILLLVVGGVGYLGNKGTTTNMLHMEELDRLALTMTEREVDHLVWTSQVQTALIEQHNSLDVQTDYHKCKLGKWIYGEGLTNAGILVPALRSELDKLVEPHIELHESAIQVEKHLINKELKDANDYYSQNTEVHLKTLQGLIKDIKSKLNQNNELVMKNTEDATTRLTMIIVASIVIGFSLALLLGILISRSLSRSLGNVSEDLAKGSNQLTNASLQVSSSSQELSSGASQLASSVEEMTSSLEELQSIIESNTKTVIEAKNMIGEANKGAKESVEKMVDLTGAIDEITDNSRKIEQIIKVIDDIAFQTNILALNAAVEAARAGDAGRGFAVVADQVKNLAQKSAEAAKETSVLIENAITSVKKGNDLGALVADNAKKSGEVMDKTDILMDEVARASQEQLKGANQVTKAIGQINSVVQNTAATSEETAASGEEMLGQAETLKGTVHNLNTIINGDKGGNQNISSHMLESTPVKPRPVQTMTLHSMDSPEEGVEIISPEDRIPLDDFKDF